MELGKLAADWPQALWGVLRENRPYNRNIGAVFDCGSVCGRLGSKLQCSFFGFLVAGAE